MSPSSYSIAHPDAIPQELRALRQWANWHGDKVIRNSRTGRNGSSTNPATWSTFAQALKADPDRLVFIFDQMNSLIGLDVDDCRNPETGEIDARGRALIEQFPDAYWEISLNRTGLHGIGRGVLPDDASGRHPEGLGCFQHSRYFVMTGEVLPGHETLGEFGPRFDTWYRETFLLKEPTPIRPRQHTAPVLGDDELIERARHARNGASFVALHDHGDLSAHGDNHSAADQSLMNYLAFWTNCNIDQMERVFTASALGRRAKWINREDYRRRTIDKAIRNCRETYSSHRTVAASAVATPESIVAAPQGQPTEALSSAEQLKLAQAKIIDLETRLAERDATIVAREAVIVRERELRKAAEARAERLAETNSKTLQILRKPDLSLGPKVAAFATILDLGARIANGEAPTEHGYRVPAIRIAEMTGQSEDTVARHQRELDRRKLIPKKKVREPGREVVDRGSGEITVVGARDANYVPVPGGNIINLIDRIIDYQRPELETGHGGIRTPRCEDHPEAGTIKRWTIECAECHQSLDSGERYQVPTPAESSGGNLHPDTGVEDTSLSGVKLPPERPRRVTRPSDGMMPPEPPLDEEPPDSWTPPPNWEDEHRRMYGEWYRGEAAS